MIAFIKGGMQTPFNFVELVIKEDVSREYAHFFILTRKHTIEASKEILKNKVYSSLHDNFRERMA